MSVNRCMQEVSPTEYKVWMYRFKEKIKFEKKYGNQPNKADYYAMQIAAEVKKLRYAFYKMDIDVPIGSMKLVAEDDADNQEQQTTSTKPVKQKQAKTINALGQARIIARVPGATMPDFEKWRVQ